MSQQPRPPSVISTPPGGAWDRRSVLRWGVLGGLTLPQVLRANAAAPVDKRQNSVILLHMRGGPSQLDTWDMKPNAPVEYRGEFKPIPTVVPGIDLCEWLPRSAAIMDKWSIIRSLEHPQEYGDVSHSRGDQVVFTGHAPGINENVNTHPSVGSVVARQLQDRDRSMLAYVMVPRMIPGTGPAYLGAKCAPFETLADPANRGQKFEVPNLSIPTQLDLRPFDEFVKRLSLF